jgi:peptide chain release factor 1
MLEQLEAIRERFLEVEQQIAMPEVVSDLKRFKTLSKEYKDLQKIVNQYISFQNIIRSIEEAKEVIANEKDEDFRDMAKAELEELLPQQKELEELLKEMLIPRDPNDSKDCILEVRGGTGGDEASIFAGDIFRMYQRYAEKMGWTFQIMDFTPGSAGGFKEIIASVQGEDVYAKMKRMCNFIFRS